MTTNVAYDYRLVVLSIVLMLARRLCRVEANQKTVWLGALLRWAWAPVRRTLMGLRLIARAQSAFLRSTSWPFSVSTFLLLGAAIASSFFDRSMATQKGDLNQARERELYFQTMAEAVPEMIWTTGPIACQIFSMNDGTTTQA